jgi:hypothetical protein
LKRALDLLGRGIGMLAGGLTSFIWIYEIWLGDVSITGVSVLVAGLLAFASLIAAIAAFHGQSAIVFIVFVPSFLPIGGYLLGVDHWLRIVGVLNILLLLAGLMIWFGRRSAGGNG